MADKVKRVVLTPRVRMSYPKLIEAVPYTNPETKQKGAPKFSLQLILELAGLKQFQQKGDDGKWMEPESITDLLKEMAAEAWPDTPLGTLFPKNKKGQLRGWPIKSGDLYAAYLEDKGQKGDAYAGKKFMPCSSAETIPPKLMVRTGPKKITTLDRDDADDLKLIKKYFGNGGNYARAEITLAAVEVDERMFLTPYINGLLYAGEGEPLGSGSMEGRFEGVEGGEGDYDPTADMADGEGFDG